MKKKTFALALMAIYVAVLVGGSLAYFTAEDRAVNVITIGKVDIEIVEYHRENGELKEIHYDESLPNKGMPASFPTREQKPLRSFPWSSAQRLAFPSRLFRTVLSTLIRRRSA